MPPPKKRTKNDARGRDRVEINREIVAGLELTAKHQRASEHAGYYPNSNRRPTVSDPSLFRSVMRLLADISADRTNPVKVSQNITNKHREHMRVARTIHVCM